MTLDLLVAGAGPSGLAAAIAAASRGLSVRVVDPRAGTIDKACGEGLMPTALALLDQLGVQRPTGRPFVGIRYLHDGAQVDGTFPQGPGLGVRRLALHEALAARAAELGVQRVVGELVDPVLLPDRVQLGEHTARWLIVADGLRSPLRHQLHLDRPTRWPRRYGLRQHFTVRPWSDRVEVYWADDAEAYVTPVGDELVGIAFLFGDAARDRDRASAERAAPFHRLLHRFPALAERLAGAPIASQLRGAGPFAVRAAEVQQGRALLIGDAAGYLDPITGEGVKLGLGAAVAAVDAILADRPTSYPRAWRRLYRPYAWSTGALLRLTAQPTARRLLVPTLRRAPWLFDRILGSLVG